jgi:hypothetical protein
MERQQVALPAFPGFLREWRNPSGQGAGKARRRRQLAGGDARGLPGQRAPDFFFTASIDDQVVAILGVNLDLKNKQVFIISAYRPCAAGKAPVTALELKNFAFCCHRLTLICHGSTIRLAQLDAYRVFSPGKDYERP